MDLHLLDKNKTISKASDKSLLCSERLASDTRINQLLGQLYPALEINSEDDPNPINRSQSILQDIRDFPSSHRNQLTKGKKKQLLVHDLQSSKRKLQNKISMNQAQRELDQRLKERVIRKYQKTIQTEPDGGESYSKIYQKLKTETQRQIIHHSGASDPPEVSPDGINYYTELKDKGAILSYTRKKMEERNSRETLEPKNGLKKKADIDESFLKLLSRRKRKTGKFVMKMPEDWQKDAYNSQMLNIEKVSKRLKKIYIRTSPREIDDEAQEDLQKSHIWKRQQKILQSFSKQKKNYKLLSKDGKQQLLKKFGEILLEIGKSFPTKKDKNFNERVKGNKSLSISHNSQLPSIQSGGMQHKKGKGQDKIVRKTLKKLPIQEPQNGEIFQPRKTFRLLHRSK